MENEKRKIRRTFLSKASEKYSKQTGVRVAVQVIPYVGGALDTLFSSHGSKIQQSRIAEFIDDVNRRLSVVENKQELEPSEELYDLAISIFEGVAKSRSKDKRKYFASLLVNKVISDTPWEEAETAARLLASLDGIHVKVLLLSVEAPVCDPPFDNLRVVTLSDHAYGDKAGPYQLLQTFPGYSVAALRMVCSELVSKGLLYDEGVGRLDARAMEDFVATDLTRWFLSWITSKE